MNRDQLFARATDPKQYDSAGLDWPREGVPSSPAMQFFQRSLRPELGDLRGKSVLDIGCGTGLLCALFDELGARRAVGLEPSARNAAAARRQFPELEIVEDSLQSAELSSRFDLAVAVMSFEHQPELGGAFRRVHDLLVPAGRFLLVVGDKPFHLTPRFGLGLEIHELPDGSALVATAYPFGTLHDVIRPVSHYLEAARAAGWNVLRTLPLVPTRELIETDAGWGAFEGRPLAHLLVMEKLGTAT